MLTITQKRLAKEAKGFERLDKLAAKVSFAVMWCLATMFDHPHVPSSALGVVAPCMLWAHAQGLRRCFSFPTSSGMIARQAKKCNGEW